MARILHHQTLPTLPAARPVAPGHALLVLTQLVLLGAIGLIIAIAIVNTILGTPQSEPVVSPYS